MRQQSFSVLFVVLSMVMAGCATVDETSKKSPQLGLITTPPTYYTTQRARYLGEKYKTNLDRLVERIVRSPKTANLQFANNIASVGGIGFFTHSATSSVDERFLEVVMGVPETFDTKSDHNAKVSRVFALYGAELLSILASDQEIYQEKELNGYGLNLSWRNVVPEANGPRIALERTVLYFSKARVRTFLKGELNQNALLGEGVIFAVIEDGPMKLVSFRPQELKPDLRLPIQEETLATERGKSKPGPKREGLLAVPLAVKPPLSTQGLENVPTESSSFDKSVELTASSAFRETPKDPGKTGPPLGQPIEVPVFSSSVPIESAETKELPVNQTAEAVLRNQESAEHASQLASLEQQKTETQPIFPKTNLIPARMPVVAPFVDSSLNSLETQQTTAKMPEKAWVTLPSPQVLQGFIIQVAFADRREAQRWAETLERRGHAVSMTEAAGGGSVRLRVGSFMVREEAERQLQALRQDGLKGIVLSLPQAYRPAALPASVEQNGKTVSVVQ